MRVSVVGATGRVGSALVEALAGRFEVMPASRIPAEDPRALAARALEDVDVVVNAAGVAHVERPTPDDLDRLRAANVELPSLLAAAAVERRASMVHISSVKAASPESTPYARAKAEGDARLEREWAAEFERLGTSLVIVRPLALLFPPLDAGKVARLRWLAVLPELLTPGLPLPVLASSTFVGAITAELESIERADSPGGLRWREFGRSERGTLRDVREAFRGEKARSR